MNGRILACALGMAWALGCSVAPNDAEIGRRVERKLADDSTLGPAHIGANAKDGEVTLTGEVPSATERSRAEEIAQHVDGVLRVSNQLAVAAHEPPPVASPPPPGPAGATTAPVTESSPPTKHDVEPLPR